MKPNRSVDELFERSDIIEDRIFKVEHEIWKGDKPKTAYEQLYSRIADMENKVIELRDMISHAISNYEKADTKLGIFILCLT